MNPHFSSLTEIKQHLNSLEKALDAERLDEQKYYESIVENKPIKTQIEQGLAVFPVRYESQYYTVGDKIEITFEQTGNLEFKHKLKVGAGVQISHNNGEIAISGVLSYLRRTTFKVLIGDNQLDGIHLSGSTAFALKLSYDSRPHNVMLAALATIQKNIENRDLRPYVEGIYMGKDFDLIESPSLQSESQLYANLNASQQQAVSEALGAFPYHVIHGPPGTGKTTTLISLIQQLSFKEKTILVCAGSNNAVDLLTERCHAAGLTVTRVGNIARVSDDLLPLCLDEKVRNHKDWAHIKKVKIEAEEARRQANKFKRAFGPEERRQRKMLQEESRQLKKWAYDLENKLVEQVLQSSQVITSTLIGTENSMMKNLRFKTVVIDEASQTLEPECWVAMLKAERVLFAGDHKQLPPTVKSQNAIDLGLQQTLFERIIQAPKHQTLLDTQYRMNDAILSFSNKTFYNQQLKSAPHVQAHTLRGDTQPLVFIDTAGTGFEEEMNPQQRSFKNPGEFFIIKEHMLSMLERIVGYEIGIISPYKEQVRHMLDTIGQTEELHNLDIHIDSIDGFQGQEKDIIYISLVRSNEGNNIGFLEDPRRLNVALTRARKKLVLVGDSSTLVISKMYTSLINHIETTGEFKSAWEYMSY